MPCGESEEKARSSIAVASSGSCCSGDGCTSTKSSCCHSKAKEEPSGDENKPKKSEDCSEGRCCDESTSKCCSGVARPKEDSKEESSEVTSRTCCNTKSCRSDEELCGEQRDHKKRDHQEPKQCCDDPPCCGGKTSSAHVHEKEVAGGALCLAVIRESGTDIVIFDASGRPRAFRYQGDIRKLCFSSHGSDCVDDLLTPCFDEDGNHGVPDESCFCGVDMPHIHAHLRDPKRCGDDAEGCSTGGHTDIAYLAGQTLLPVTDQDEETLDGFSDDESNMLNITVSETMPKECNSQEVKLHMDQSGASSHRKRISKVKHDDHLDFLVHNAKTGELRLEHPCQNCGLDDVHGTFKKVGKRHLTRQGSSDIHVHFFEVGQRPFSLLNHIPELFLPQSDRVAAVENIMETLPAKRRPSFESQSTQHEHEVKASASVRSTFACTGICCPSETPVITRILEPVRGVHKVMVNVSVKQVLVDHDPQLISTNDLACLLTKNGFTATVKYDGSAAVTAATALATEIGRSVLYVEGICCASEVPVIKSILEPMSGVDTVTVNTTAKLVYVNHNLALVTAEKLADALNGDGFGAEVREDAAKSVMSAQSAFVRSILSCDNGDPDNEKLTTFLRTFESWQMESFVVDVPARSITVIHNPFVLTAQTIADALLAGTGINSTVTTDGADPKTWSIPEWDSSAENLDVDESRTYPRLTVVLSGICWIISMLNYIGGNWEYLEYVGLASVAVGIPPIAIKAFRTLRRFQFDANCLMFFASIGALALQEFAEAAAIVFLFSISEWLEVRATSRARRALSAIVQLRPEKANIVHPTSKELIVVPASSVPVGAIVSVKPGDKFPCDGLVVEGVSTVDESSLTGESRPIRKCPNDEVSGGTVNSGLTPLMVRTTCTADNSAVARLIRLVEEAQVNKSATEKFVDEFARVYTPIIVVAAIFMVTIPWAFGTEVGRTWTNNGLVLIVVACPCALIISTPVSYVAGLAAAAQKGVLIKGGAHLEALGLVKQICFDKTGTLTNGEFALLQLHLTCDSLSRKEVLEYLSLMEEQASHPVANAIMKAALNEKVSVPRSKVLSKHAIVEGEGVAGVVDALDVYVGNERMFARLQLLESLSDNDRKLFDSWKSIGGSVGFMSVEGMGIVCAFCAADGIRPESAEVVRKLKKQGIKTVMLTGDNRNAALAIGRQIGLTDDDVMSGLLPEEKLRHVEDLSGTTAGLSVITNPFSSRRLTMMVGDGVNDAPALAVADIGVAMGAGAALAMETADVTLLDSNLEKLEYAMVMGRRVLNKIKQNIVFSLAVKFTVLGFALAGMTNLWAAIGTDVGAMILVTLNSMTLLPGRQRSSDVQALKADIEKGNISNVNIPSRDDEPNSSSCKKGCCSGSGASTLPAKDHAPASSCKKGCCSGSGAPSPPVDPTTASSCKKGCCSGSDAPTPAMKDRSPTSSCKKGCCSGSDAPTPAMKDHSPASSIVGPVQSKEKQPSSEACAKGCCGTKGAIDVSVSSTTLLVGSLPSH